MFLQRPYGIEIVFNGTENPALEDRFLSSNPIPQRAYTSEITDVEWDIIFPFLFVNTGRGAKNKHRKIESRHEKKD
jgi:hypothetical protein